MVGPPKRKSRGALKFLASTCIFSAWITLILSVIGAFGTFMFAATFSLGSAMSAPSAPSTLPGLSPNNPTLSGPGGDDLGIKPAVPGLENLGSSMGTAMLGRLIAPICYAWGAFTLVSGIVTFILFLGLGQACYILIDLEEQNFKMNEALTIIIARLGQGR